jgi:hypothetical protein
MASFEFVVQETIKTEDEYLGRLLQLEMGFLHRLESSKDPCVTELIKSTIRAMELPTIIKLHTELFVSYKANNCKQIGKIFLDKLHYFRLYHCFFTNYAQLERLVSQQRDNNSKFQSLFEQMEKEANSPLNFFSLLVEPVQRLPRYQLLFQRIIKEGKQDPEKLDGDLQNCQTFEESLGQILKVLTQRIEEVPPDSPSKKPKRHSSLLQLKSALLTPLMQQVLKPSLEVDKQQATSKQSSSMTSLGTSRSLTEKSLTSTASEVSDMNSSTITRKKSLSPKSMMGSLIGDWPSEADDVTDGSSTSTSFENCQLEKIAVRDLQQQGNTTITLPLVDEPTRTVAHHDITVAIQQPTTTTPPTTTTLLQEPLDTIKKETKIKKLASLKTMLKKGGTC